MKEIKNNNGDNIGFSSRDGSLDYLLKEKPVVVCADVLSECLSEKGARVRRVENGNKCFDLRFLSGFSSDATYLLREEIEINSGRLRFIIQREGVSSIQGLMIENDAAVKSVGIDRLNQKNSENFINEFVEGFLQCRSFASIKQEE